MMKNPPKTMESRPVPIAEKIREVFEEKGQRQTRTRSRIADRLAILATRGEDFTVEGLWHDLLVADPHMGRATVFRAVEMLVAQGVLNRIEFANGSHSYRVCGEVHHHHLTCVQCHRVVDIDVCIPADLLKNIGIQTDFKIEGHSLALFGLCADCRN
jgi:Fur family transcriptional regulator, ferric uptake regulator